MGFWEKVLPGYQGYRQREDSRNTDKILREHLSAKLKESRSVFDDFKEGLTRRGNLGLLNPAEKLTQTLGRLVDRLRYANYGFSGRWLGQQIDQAELDKVLSFDKQMASKVEQFGQGVQTLESIATDAQLETALADLIAGLREMEQALNEREQVLRTFDGQALK